MKPAAPDRSPFPAAVGILLGMVAWGITVVLVSGPTPPLGRYGMFGDLAASASMMLYALVGAGGVPAACDRAERLFTCQRPEES